MEAVSQLVSAAEQQLGPKAVITDPMEIEPWTTDWRGRVHGTAPAMLAPASTEEVAAIADDMFLPASVNEDLARLRARGGA